MTKPEQPAATETTEPAKPATARRGAAKPAPADPPAPPADPAATLPTITPAVVAPADPIPADSPTADSPTGDALVGDAPGSDAPGGAPATDAGADQDPAAEAAPEKRRRGRPKGSTAKTTRTIELILTVSGTADGEWQAELKQGSTWLSRALPVTAAAVARAAAELHAELAEPIEAAIGVAREERAARVAALEAELEQARKALAEIDD